MSVRRLVRRSKLRVTEHRYQIGLEIHHTNWRCCTLHYNSELCLLICFVLLVHTGRLPDSFGQFIRATLFLFTT